ncbi:MAG: DNA-binding transcriptional regulator Fis [Candidatus Competibacteraceae bacterium]|nr:DNA-binding transcriptional regulator Fis [Candidatus Competibacteraceae bacterium]
MNAPGDEPKPTPLRVQVEAVLHDYFRQLDGEMPHQLYRLVLQEVEQPLLTTVMHYTRGNQTRAAEILGINRTTLRKKLRQYGIE